MKKPLQLVAMLIIVALVAAAACYVSARLFGTLRRSTVDGHEWIHKQLNLTQGELKALEPIETRFAERKRNLMGEIRSANKELAEAIKQDQADSPRVSAAVEKIHHAQGKLQEATLAHVFALEDRSYAETAELLGISPKAVEMKVYRARKLLLGKMNALGF